MAMSNFVSGQEILLKGDDHGKVREITKNAKNKKRRDFDFLTGANEIFENFEFSFFFFSIFLKISEISKNCSKVRFLS